MQAAYQPRKKCGRRFFQALAVSGPILNLVEIRVSRERPLAEAPCFRTLTRPSPSEPGRYLMRSLVCLLILLVPALVQAGGEEGFVPLFNGKDLTGWEV